MRRSDFLKLTAVKVDRFKALLRRNQLPFRPEDIEESVGWSDYSPFEAFLTVLSLDLATTADVRPDVVASLFATFAHRIQQNWTTVDGRQHDCFAGYALASNPNHALPERIFLFGTIDQIAATITAQSQNKSVHGVALANASQAWRTIIKRAVENDITINHPF